MSPRSTTGSDLQSPNALDTLSVLALTHSCDHERMIDPPAPITQQLFGLFILAIPIATIARTVVYEEIFREFHDWCKNRSTGCPAMWQRKLFYMFTCEYCFSHWVTLAFLLLTGFKLLINDWRGYVIAWFALVFVANIYLNLFARLRVEITGHKKRIEKIEAEIDQVKAADARENEANGQSALERSSKRSAKVSASLDGSLLGGGASGLFKTDEESASSTDS